MSEKSKPRGLGRGLNALFEDDEELVSIVNPSGDVASVGHNPQTGRVTLGVEQLEPGSSQPRIDFDPDALEALASSIKIHGILQPLLVRPKLSAETGEAVEGQYEIIAGERRWRAAQLAQLHEVPVVIRELENEQAMQIALIENLQREDLNPIEEAFAYQRLIDEHDYTQAKLAEALGKSRSHIANMTRLLSLPEVVLNSVRDGELSPGHARCLIPLDNPEELAQKIIKEGLSVRATEKLAQSKSLHEDVSIEEDKGTTVDPLSKALQRINKIIEDEETNKDADLLALESELSTHLGMHVDVNMANGSDVEGILAINFKSLDQLDKILKLLNEHETLSYLHNDENSIDEAVSLYGDDDPMQQLQDDVVASEAEEGDFNDEAAWAEALNEQADQDDSADAKPKARLLD